MRKPNEIFKEMLENQTDFDILNKELEDTIRDGSEMLAVVKIAEQLDKTAQAIKEARTIFERRLE